MMFVFHSIILHYFSTIPVDLNEIVTVLDEVCETLIVNLVRTSSVEPFAFGFSFYNNGMLTHTPHGLDSYLCHRTIFHILV